MKIDITPDILTDGHEFPMDLFEDPTNKTSGAIYHWDAYANGAEIDVWRTADGGQSRVMKTTGLNDDLRQRLINEGFPTAEFKHTGTLSRGEALAGCLIWLAKNTDEDDNLLEPPIDPDSRDYDDEVVGVLDNGNGPVFVTGIGTLIFGNHIRAMQQRGRADYQEL